MNAAWEQRKLEARKMLENAAESHTSDARFVGTVLIFITYAKLIENNLRQPIKLKGFAETHFTRLQPGFQLKRNTQKKHTQIISYNVTQ